MYFITVIMLINNTGDEKSPSFTRGAIIKFNYLDESYNLKKKKDFLYFEVLEIRERYVRDKQEIKRRNTFLLARCPDCATQSCRHGAG